MGAALGTSLLLCGSAWAKTAQTITLQEPSGAVVGASFTEPGESSVGLEVALVTETPSVCILSYSRGEATGTKPSWTIALIEGGTCTVTAKQAGDGEYEAAEARLSFTVSGPRHEPQREAEVHPGHKSSHTESAPRRKAALELALKACEKDKSKSQRKPCEDNARALQCRSTNGSQCAVLIIHEYGVGRLANSHPPYPEEGGTLRIVKLASGPRCGVSLPRCWGKVLSSRTTTEHELSLAPGRYGIASVESTRPGSHVYTAKEVTVSAGQRLEVTLDIHLK